MTRHRRSLKSPTQQDDLWWVAWFVIGVAFFLTLAYGLG
jgi:hypothetical protein